MAFDDQWTDDQRAEYQEAYEREQSENPLRSPVHEAGHAVVAYHHRYSVHGVSIGLAPGNGHWPGPAFGQTHVSAPWPYEEDPFLHATWSRLRTAAEFMVAGQVAEIECLGIPSVRDAEIAWGGEYSMLELAVFHVFPHWTEDRRDAYIDDAEARALKIVRANRLALDRLADCLLSEQTIEGPRLEQLLKPIRRRRERASDREREDVQTECDDLFRPTL